RIRGPAGLDRLHPHARERAVIRLPRARVDTDRRHAFALREGLEGILNDVTVDRVVVVERVVAGVVHADDRPVGIDERAARVAAADARVVLDDLTERGPLRVEGEVVLRDDAAREGELLGGAEGVTGRVHVEAGLDLALVPAEEREALAFELHDGEVEAFGCAEYFHVDLVVGVAAEEARERAGADDDVVVGDGETGCVDDEPGTHPAVLGRRRGARLDERALTFEVDGGGLHVVEVDCFRAGRRRGQQVAAAQCGRGGGEQGDGDGCSPRRVVVRGHVRTPSGGGAAGGRPAISVAPRDSVGPCRITPVPRTRGGREGAQARHAEVPSMTRQNVSVQSKVKRCRLPWPSREHASVPVISNVPRSLNTESTDGTRPPPGSAEAHEFMLLGGDSGSANGITHPQFDQGRLLGWSASTRRVPSATSRVAIPAYSRGPQSGWGGAEPAPSPSPHPPISGSS